LPEGRAALAEICQAYWYPVYAFVRRKGLDPDDAQDLVQGFFSRLLEHEDLHQLDPAKGKFRSFLMAACSHFLANQRDHQRAQKRGGGRTLLTIDRLESEARYSREPAHDLTPERLYLRRWATTLLEHVLERLGREQDEAGKGRLFAALKPTLLGESGAATYQVLGNQLGLSEGAVRVAAHRLRERFRTLLREEVGRTLDDPAKVDEEIRDLFAALSS
jgi:RNA polymerase sigma-70 factor (ECF subfamily)